MHLDLYRRFTEMRPAADVVGKIVPYGWTKLPDPLEGIWMTYSFMLDDFARELANAVNAFTLNVRRLKAWESLLPALTEKEQDEAMHEFVEPLATLCLLTPYMVRSRFLFATAHLCHQVNLVRDKSWPESSLPVDAEIYMASADVQGAPWKRYTRFKTRIEGIGGKALQRATADFRNAFTHRFSPRVGKGITNFATRHLNPKTGEVIYAFGGTEPLALGEVVGLLVMELDRCYKTFEAFQQLVGEHEAFIIPYNEVMFAKRRATSTPR